MLAAPALCVLLAALAIAACGEDGSPESEPAAATPGESPPEHAEAPAPPADGAAPSAGAQAESSGGPKPRPVLPLPAPKGAHPVVWVRAHAKVPVRSRPGGGEVVQVAGRRTRWGSLTVFSVVKRRGEWAGVTTHKVPNGELGWIRLDPSRLRSGWTPVEVHVDLSERRATLIEEGKVVRSFPVTIGAPGSPTPTGRFAVTDTFRGNLNKSYGCCALALSATQPSVPSGWFGGNRIAIHGTTGPLGVAASHGCVRARDRDVSMLVNRAGLGTPVFIRA